MEILEHGNIKNVKRCFNCGCRFRYDEKDVVDNYEIQETTAFQTYINNELTYDIYAKQTSYVRCPECEKIISLESYDANLLLDSGVSKDKLEKKKIFWEGYLGGKKNAKTFH